MVFSASFMSVVRYVQLHELIKSSEPVSKTCIFNSFFIRYYIIIKCLEAWDRVYNKVTIAGYLAHRVVEQSDVHDHRQ